MTLAPNEYNADVASIPHLGKIMNKIPAKDFMQRDPVTANPEMPLISLVALLRKEGRRGLPVTDEENRLVGVISETDLFLKDQKVPFSSEKVPSLLGQVIDMGQAGQVPQIRETKVKQVMTQQAATIGEDTTLEDTALLMHKRRLSMVPVVSDGVLVGVVRRNDILGILYREKD